MTSPKSKAQKNEDKVTRNIVIVMVALVVLLPISVVGFKELTKPEKSTAIPTTVNVEKGYAISFNTDLVDVPVLDIYEDFQCPICQQFEGVNIKYINSLIAEKKATVNYHILSFIGDESVRAANGAACANDEGKFLEYHSAMYANQPQAENSGAWSDKGILAIASAAGIESKTFENCVKDQKYITWVEKVAAAGAEANVNATPTVFVNGKEINRNSDYFDAANFKAAVEG